MKMPKSILVACLLCMHLITDAQVQWYQNQDGNNPPPYGTVATTVHRFSSGHFVASYLWSSTNETNTWKISKTSISGVEEKTFFATGISSTVECKPGKNNSVIVFERSFTPDYAPIFKVYKLNANLEVTGQRNIEFPNGYAIYNINAFEIDKLGNIYFAGDGQYPNGGGTTSPASFVIKTDKNLATQWRRMDSTETSFTRLHIDRVGRVLIIQDHYTFFPEVRIKRYGHNGQIMNPFIIQTDINRYTLYSKLDNDDNILLYGGVTVNETSQAMYLKRVSRVTGNIVYNKTHFEAPSSQLNDLRVDKHGNIFTLVSQYFGPGDQHSKISRISLSNGAISWTKSIDFATDSCNLTRLVMDDNDRFFAVGERRSCSYFSKGFAIRVKKTGQLDGNFPAPDSVAFQRSHLLADGVIDDNHQLIAIGHTMDFDTLTYSNNYFRSFAVRFGNNNGCDEGKGIAEPATTTKKEQADEIDHGARVLLYPNPVQGELTVTNIDPSRIDRVTIYNLQGIKLQQRVVTNTMEKMDISRLPNGVYILVLNSSTSLETKTLRFMVKK